MTNDISGYPSYDIPRSEGRKGIHELEAEIGLLPSGGFPLLPESGSRRPCGTRIRRWGGLVVYPVESAVPSFMLPINTNAIGHHLELFTGRDC